MIRAETVCDKGEAFEAADTITLDEQQRHRRRMAMVSDGGIAFLLDLAETRLLREGDGIRLDDGRIVKVVAKSEPLYAVRGQNAAHLLSLAWHLGNRHQAAQIFGDHILIRREPVLREMLLGLHAVVEDVDAPFDPEGGAYAHHHHQHGDEARPLTAAHD
ncbi:urease accessory protein UreE [Aureimonas endophytica]|uniref:Urease accessory protein UreE n=1 Tax=Aureimonas endophytica TaxID=2027858 RepID=A0A917A014_9HYPH|nr:urease accessory protein UreE [Aureimonas endophytica]GGE20621.1 urease accessory protein UreE [Aureimonas endophytica]